MERPSNVKNPLINDNLAISLKKFTKEGSWIYSILFLIIFIYLFLLSIEDNVYPSLYPLNMRTFPPFNEKFSIIFATYQPRIQLMSEKLRNISYGQSKYLDSIFMYWIDANNPIPDITTFIDPSNITVPIYILESPNISLTDRFLIPKQLRTQTILSLDDDLPFTAESMDFAFEIYLTNHFENRIFGTFQRTCGKKWYSIPTGDGTYNMVLTGFAFLSREMYEVFNSPEYADLRQHVKELHNGEDILMNYIVTKHFKAPPVGFEYDRFQKTKGLSKTSGHQTKRNKLCKELHHLFGKDSVRNYPNKGTHPFKQGLIENVYDKRQISW